MRFLIDINFVKVIWSGKRRTVSMIVMLTYQYIIPSLAPIIEIDRPLKFDFDIVLLNQSFIILSIIVYYRACFGNDRTESKLLLLKKNKAAALKIIYLNSI